MFWLNRFIMVCVLCFASSALASVGKVSLVKGEAFVQRNTTKTPLGNGAFIEEKDVISTGKDAHIQLIFEDKTVITLGSESVFKIEEYLNDATNPKAKFKFNQGTFKTITGNIGKKAPENFTLETKTATIGIRGTWIRGKIEPDGDWVWCLRGKIFVRSLHDGRLVELFEGHKTFVGLNQTPRDPLPTDDDDFNDEQHENGGTQEGSLARHDYRSWGYWEQRDFRTISDGINDQPLEEGVFEEEEVIDPLTVPTPSSYITDLINLNNPDIVYVYTGTVAGTVMEPTAGTISATNNVISIAVQFATSSVSGTVDFKSASGTIDYTSNGNLIIDDGVLTGGNGFTGALVGQGANYMATGTIDGTFYGPNAEKTMGTFSTNEGMGSFAKTTNGTFHAVR